MELGRTGTWIMVREGTGELIWYDGPRSDTKYKCAGAGLPSRYDSALAEAEKRIYHERAQGLTHGSHGRLSPLWPGSSRWTPSPQLGRAGAVRADGLCV